VEWKDLSYAYYAEGNEIYDYVHGAGESYWTIHDEQQGEWNLYYGYDGVGLRLYRRLEGPGTNQVEVYVYDRRVRPERVLCEYDAEGCLLRSYVWAAGRILAQVESDGTVYFFHADELGSTLALSDTNGEVVAQYAYLPYGTIATNRSPLLTPFLWLGGLGVYHEDVPLKKAGTVYYMRHRYYDAAQRRFISPDPLGIEGLFAREALLNLFVYAKNNPLAFQDPLGLWGVPGAIFGGVVGAVSGGITGYTQEGWQGAAQGALVGGVVGAIVGVVAPQASSTAGTLGMAALTGAGASAFSQQSVGIIHGQSWSESARNVNWWMVGGASAGGAMGVGVNTVFMAQIPIETQVITGSGPILQAMSSVGGGMLSASMELTGGLIGESVNRAQQVDRCK